MAEFPRNNLGSEELSSIPHNHKLSLTVQECSSTSFSEVYLSHGVMTKHKFWNGYPKVLLGKEGLRTACTFLTDPAPNENEAVQVPVPDDKIKINSRIRAKLAVSVGDSVTILKDESIPDGKTVCARPFEEYPRDLDNLNLLEAYLWPHFKDAIRPVHRGDEFPVTRSGKRIKFKITNVDPSPFCIVGPGTRIECKRLTPEESKAVESIRQAASAQVLQILESSANIGRVKNGKTDKEPEQSDNRSGSSSSNKHVHNVNTNANSSEGNGRGGGQFDDKVDPLKRKHSESMAQATTKSRKSEAKVNAPVSTTATKDSDDDDWGWESEWIGGGGSSSSLVSSSFTGKSVSNSLADEDDWDSPATENSRSQATASGRSTSLFTQTASRQNSVTYDPWNNNVGKGESRFRGKGGGGLDFGPQQYSAYDGKNRLQRESFGGAHPVSWKRGDRGGGGGKGWAGRGRGYEGRGGSRGSRVGNNRGDSWNGVGKGFRGRGGHGRGCIHHRGNNSSVRGAHSHTPTSSNIADADEDWETPLTLLAPTPAPVPSRKTYSSSEIDDCSDPTGSRKLDDDSATGKPRVELNNPKSQCNIESATEEIDKVKPKPKPIKSPSFSQPPPCLTEVRVGNFLERSNDCQQEGIIQDPSPVELRNVHQNRNSEPSLTEEELSAQHQLAHSLFLKAQFADALSGFEVVLDKRTTLLGPHHVDTLRSHFFVGRCLFKQDKVTEAKNILDQILTIQKLYLPADHGDIEETEFAVARCFDVLEQHEDAETLYRILCAKANKRLGHSHKSTLITLYNLAHALDKQNKLDESMKWYGVFVAMGVQYLGPENELVVYGQERIECIFKSNFV